MKISVLEQKFIDRLKEHLPDWRYVHRDRTFTRSVGSNVWHFHITCIKHSIDFDSTGDVAVEFKSKNVRQCIIGAELGNIEGVGQKRFAVSNERQAVDSASAIYNYFCEVGMPFFEKYSDPDKVVNILRLGGKEAMLISPIISLHNQQIESLGQHHGASM